MTSAGAESFGVERANLTTEPANCSGWPPILYIGALPLWEPIFGG
jgi:hypothetical protein